jgi:hypothetical protein
MASLMFFLSLVDPFKPEEKGSKEKERKNIHIDQKFHKSLKTIVSFLFGPIEIIAISILSSSLIASR